MVDPLPTVVEWWTVATEAMLANSVWRRFADMAEVDFKNGDAPN